MSGIAKTMTSCFNFLAFSSCLSVLSVSLSLALFGAFPFVPFLQRALGSQKYTKFINLASPDLTALLGPKLRHGPASANCAQSLLLHTFGLVAFPLLPLPFMHNIFPNAQCVLISVLFLVFHFRSLPSALLMSSSATAPFLMHPPSLHLGRSFMFTSPFPWSRDLRPPPFSLSPQCL